MKKFLFLLLLPLTLFANMADPWWNTSWRYRVEVNLPTAQAGQTGKLNMDFSAFSLPGTFDPTSVRIIKQDGVTVVAQQEYNDNLYFDATDAVGDTTGEVKFIVEDTGVVRYYMYYDIDSNGPYAPLGTPINGNFEYASTNWIIGNKFIIQSTPDQGITSGVTSLVTDTVGTGLTEFVVETVHTGSSAYIQGYKNSPENKNKSEQLTIRQSLVTIPASNPGNLTFWINQKGWDDVSRDFFHVDIGGTTVATYGSALATTYYDSGWVQYSIDLTPFAGSTSDITFGYQTKNDNNYKTWEVIDDVEWSVTTPTLGPQESAIRAMILKESCVINDNVNIAANAKRIPGSTVRYAVTLANTGLVDITAAVVSDPVDGSFNFGSITNIQVVPAACDCLGVVAASNNGPLGSLDGVSPVKIDFQGILTGQIKCGYFEVNVN